MVLRKYIQSLRAPLKSQRTQQMIKLFRSSLLIILLAAHTAVGLAEQPNQDDARLVRLRVGSTLKAQRIALDDETIRYTLEGLRPSTGYEVRVSFPATIPALIHLRLEAKVAAGEEKALRRESRRLLNAEKVMFRTSKHGGVLLDGKDVKEAEAVLRASKWALSKDGPDKGPPELVYDIILEESVMGIPASAFPLVVTAVISVAVCVAVLPWWAGAAAPRVVNWISAGRPRTALLPGNERQE